MNRPIVLTGTLPGSGRAFRIAVGEHALGVRVELGAADGAPFVAVVNHPITSLERAREVTAVVEVLAVEVPA